MRFYGGKRSTFEIGADAAPRLHHEAGMVGFASIEIGRKFGSRERNLVLSSVPR